MIVTILVEYLKGKKKEEKVQNEIALEATPKTTWSIVSPQTQNDM